MTSATRTPASRTRSRRLCAGLLALTLTACDGSDGGWPAAGARLTGRRPGAWFGHSLAAAGDLDGDGHAELLVGAPLDDRVAFAAGRVEIVGGRDGLPLDALDGQRAMSVFGSTLASLPDVDGDGVPELLIAAPKDPAAGHGAGRVALHSGATRALLWQRAGAPGDHLGDALAVLPDVDGDGLADVLAGAPAHDSGRPGAVVLLSGASGRELARHRGVRADDRFGQALAVLGDLDGDGAPELLVGAPEDSSAAERAGRAVVLSGADGALLHEWLGAAAFDYLGMSVANAGDVDGDGLDDPALGTPGDDTGHAGAGSVRVHAAGGWRELWRAPGEGAGHDLGGALAAVRDLDGDGVGELLATSPFGAEGRGVVLVLSGATGAAVRRHEGARPDSAWGHAACLLDGRLVVGAYLDSDGLGLVERVAP